MSISLGRLVDINPATPEFEHIPSEEHVTFLPLEACWPDGRADLSRTAAQATLAVGYTRFRRGDVLMPKITPTFEAGRIFSVESPTAIGAGTTELHILRARPGVEPRFIAYVCRSQAMLQEGHASLEGVGNLRRVPVDFLRLFPVTVFDGQQQRIIADYLDRETSQIDELIGKQKQLIATLRERRAAVIDKLIGPLSAPLRSLGSLTIKGIASGVDYAADEGEADWPRYIRTTDVSGMSTLHAGGVRRISAAQVGDSSIQRNDILFTRSGSLGKNYLHESDETMAFAGYMVRFRPRSDRCHARYVAWWSQSRHHLDQIALGASRSTINNFSGSKFRAMKIPIPSLDEQRYVSRCIDNQAAKIDHLISKTKRFIALARERRSALITAAVTGQIDVRQMA